MKMYFEFEYNKPDTRCFIRPSKKEREDQNTLSVGVAILHPGDQPNKRKGRNLAAARAIRSLVPGDRRTDPRVLQERRLAWDALRAQGVRV
jgi:hypothetical protein